MRKTMYAIVTTATPCPAILSTHADLVAAVRIWRESANGFHCIVELPDDYADDYIGMGEERTLAPAAEVFAAALDEVDDERRSDAEANWDDVAEADWDDVGECAWCGVEGECGPGGLCSECVERPKARSFFGLPDRTETDIAAEWDAAVAS